MPKIALLFILVVMEMLYGNVLLACEPCRQYSASKKEWENEIRNFFERSDAIFVATVISASKLIDNRQEHIDGSKKVVEKARFRIDKVFKGSFKVGDFYDTRSTIVIGESCTGVSVVNDPVWIRQLDQNNNVAPAQLPIQWLIYSSGNAPYQLGSCGLIPIDAATKSGEIAILESVR